MMSSSPPHLMQATRASSTEYVALHEGLMHCWWAASEVIALLKVWGRRIKVKRTRSLGVDRSLERESVRVWRQLISREHSPTDLRRWLRECAPSSSRTTRS